MTIRFPSRAPLPAAADAAAVAVEVVRPPVVLLQRVLLLQQRVLLLQRRVRLRPALLLLVVVPGDEVVAEADVAAVAARW